jgi:hypothetical protein
MDNAFEIRYGQQSSMDKITESWYSIRDAADSAKQSVEDAKNEISSLKSDRSILEYQLGIAVKYGDTLRADAIRTQLAKTNADLTQKEIDLKKAQEESSMTLVGTSQVAIKNRATLRGLVGDYNSYLLALANSGMSNEQLKVEAAKLTNEFMAQGKALGFAESELTPYISAFKNDFTTTINNLPKDITLNVNSDPALRALSEFIVRFNEELANKIANTIPITTIVTPVYKPAEPITPNVPPTGSGQTNLPPGAEGVISIPRNGYTGNSSGAAPSLDPAAARQKEINAARASVDSLKSQTASALTELTAAQRALADVPVLSPAASPQLYAVRQGMAAGVTEKYNSYSTLVSQRDSAIAALDSLLRAPIAAATGGLIRGGGTATSDSIPARLSNGEYVVKAAAVKYYGTDFMNTLNQMQMQRPVNYAASNSAQGSSSVVYLSPEDRQLLRAAIDRPVNLYTENTRIAASANAGNVVLAQRGSK